MHDRLELWVFRFAAPAALGVAFAVSGCKAPSTADLDFPHDTQSVWVGSYVCGQGVTALRVDFDDDMPDGKLRAVFEFHHPRGSGTFSLAGKTKPREGVVRLMPQEWIDYPSTPNVDWQMVGIEGKVSQDGQTFFGHLTDQQCLIFALERTSTQDSDAAFQAEIEHVNAKYAESE